MEYISSSIQIHKKNVWTQAPHVWTCLFRQALYINMNITTAAGLFGARPCQFRAYQGIEVKVTDYVHYWVTYLLFSFKLVTDNFCNLAFSNLSRSYQQHFVKNKMAYGEQGLPKLKSVRL